MNYLLRCFKGASDEMIPISYLPQCATHRKIKKESRDAGGVEEEGRGKPCCGKCLSGTFSLKRRFVFIARKCM